MKKKILFLLPLLALALVFVTSCSKDDDSASFTVSGTSLVGTWAYVDEYDRKHVVPYYFTITDDGLLTYAHTGTESPCEVDVDKAFLMKK